MLLGTRWLLGYTDVVSPCCETSFSVQALPLEYCSQVCNGASGKTVIRECVIFLRMCVIGLYSQHSILV